MDALLVDLSKMLTESFWLAPLIALLAGILTSFTPCSLSSIPLIIGYVGGSSMLNTKEAQNMKKAFILSLIFALGSALTFTVLGVLAALAGNLIGTHMSSWYIFLGIIMVLMALQTWEIYNFIPSSYLLSKNTKKGQLGAFIAGILGGIFSSPCSTPILIALLTIVASKGSLLYGIVLLLLYSVGHGILAVLAGTSVGFVQKISANPTYSKASSIIKIIMGFLILLIGFYMFYLGF